MQSAFELGFAHLRPTWDVSALRLLIEFCAGLFVPRGPIFLGCTASFARLGPSQIFPVFLLALVLRRTGFAQPDGDRLPRIPHLAPATGFELSMLKLVHHTTDGFLLRLGLMSCHLLTSRNPLSRRSFAGRYRFPIRCNSTPIR